MLSRLSNQALALVVLAALPALTAAQEHAAAHEPVGALPTAKQGIASAVTALVVFAIVFAVLAVKVWPVIGRGLDERADKIKSEIAAAEAARKQAKDALEQYERSLADARAEAQRMLEKTKLQQQALAEELRAKSEVELTAMKERARKDIEAAKRAAIGEIYTHAANAATGMASKILQREVSPRDQQRLIDEAVVELARA
jgi:F-type H+-transporting ATPase subunit b